MAEYKKTADSSGTFRLPAGQGFHLRPAAGGAAYPLTVRPDGLEVREVTLTEERPYLAGGPYTYFQVSGAGPGSEWTYTMLDGANALGAAGTPGMQRLGAFTLSGELPNVLTTMRPPGTPNVARYWYDVRGFRKVMLLAKSQGFAGLTGSVRARLCLDTNNTADGGAVEVVLPEMVAADGKVVRGLAGDGVPAASGATYEYTPERYPYVAACVLVSGGPTDHTDELTLELWGIP